MAGYRSKNYLGMMAYKNQINQNQMNYNVKYDMNIVFYSYLVVRIWVFVTSENIIGRVWGLKE